MASIISGKTPRKPVAGGRFHTIATSTPSKTSLKAPSVKIGADNGNGIVPRGADIFDLAVNETDDPAGCFAIRQLIVIFEILFFIHQILQELFLKAWHCILIQAAISKFMSECGQLMIRSLLVKPKTSFPCIQQIRLESYLTLTSQSITRVDNWPIHSHSALMMNAIPGCTQRARAEAIYL